MHENFPKRSLLRDPSALGVFLLAWGFLSQPWLLGCFSFPACFSDFTLLELATLPRSLCIFFIYVCASLRFYSAVGGKWVWVTPTTRLHWRYDNGWMNRKSSVGWREELEGQEEGEGELERMRGKYRGRKAEIRDARARVREAGRKKKRERDRECNRYVEGAFVWGKRNVTVSLVECTVFFHPFSFLFFF